MTERQNAAPGWYPIGDDMERYWTGTAWSDERRPQRVSSSESHTPSAVADLAGPFTAIALVVSIVGLILSQQSASVLSGSGTIWIGAAMTAIAFAGTFAVRKWHWVKFVTLLICAVAVFTAVYTEVELSERREEIGNFFDE